MILLLPPHFYRTMAEQLKQIAQTIGAHVIGNDRIPVHGVASIASAGPHDLVFAEEKSSLAAALDSKAAAVIAGPFAENAQNSKPVLVVANPKLAFAQAARLLHAGPGMQVGVHPSAIVHPSARLGDSVSLGASAVIGQAHIGSRTHIGANCVISDGVSIGDDCHIHPNVTIYSGTRIANRVVVHAGAVLGSDGFGYVRNPATGRHEKFPQIGRLEIEDDVEIGANSTIDRGALEVTHIGRGAKIDNLVHIGHNCRVGENVIIAAQSGFSGSISIGNDAIIGGQVGVGEHARIEEGVLLGGQAGVLPKKVVRGKGVAFWGTPARPLREYLKTLAALARLAKKED
jgi:UDP-3-O-[3-hydroxymyristoyl] glucosamine N-acyltransferase